MKNTTHEIRQSFLNFFKTKGHIIIPSSSLIPKDDTTLLFTNAGMNQFKDFFLGQKNSTYSKIATVQRCLRTGGKHNDLDNVGYTEKHHTFFEMLGNFSFNDYFKLEAIQYAWELLTSQKWFNIPKNKLWISVYKDDNETYEIWKNIIKVPIEHIIKIGDKNNCQYNSENFWQMSDNGPCGPCTEIFYDYGNGSIDNITDFIENKTQRFLEIWNIVFIEFNRISKTNIIPLPNKSIDTGMGLERISSVLQNVRSNYNIDIFDTLIKKISKFSNLTNSNHISLKIIADHIRSSTYIIADGIKPSNEHRGYVLRRIIRRALRHGRKIGIKKIFFYKLAQDVAQVMGTSANFFKDKIYEIEKILKIEEIQFSKTLDVGLKILNKKLKHINNNILSGKIAFYLYDTFGFPVDLTEDICREKKIQIDYVNYKLFQQQQRSKSKSNTFYKNYNDDIIVNDICIFQGYKKNKITAKVKHIFVNKKPVLEICKNEHGIIFLDRTTFYSESGGQIGDTGQLYYKTAYFEVENTKKYGNTIGHIGKMNSGIIKLHDCVYSEINQERRTSIQNNHSATHLLHATLRKTLGNVVEQKGSLVTDTHLRFDFSFSGSITLPQIHEIEKIINNKIFNNIAIKTKEINLEDAKQQNAIALFHNQYRSVVRTVFIEDFSIELCKGTHATRTGNIGIFKIVSHRSVASGIKRIEAITGKMAIKHWHKQENQIQNISSILHTHPVDITEKIQKLIVQQKHLTCKLDKLKNKDNINQINKIIRCSYEIKGVKILIHKFYNHNYKELKEIVQQLQKKIEYAVIILINIVNNHFTMISGITKNLVNSITAKSIIDIVIQETHGNGGGKNDLAAVGTTDIKKLDIILKKITLWINRKLKNN
ncbi:MAG: alanine--tRNA ligase [Buchnera aphidicola (Pentalonia nigronervosa)]|uniref:Alanine--tRNA ligase n=1 Tax=Buchnera aphidicola (Pentalonia nigronervosa) TaxID=1309793 RepID=A0A7H1B014_9GAMM|nr:MAG: alanine--tRNA ligase [Buchnera aphidicola (Pentalonia nigronervosa)]